MNWPTQFREHVTFNTEIGSRYEDIYHPVIDKETGHIELELDRAQTKDIYAEIQSHKDSVDLHKIIERYRAGDVDALQRVQGMYGDLTIVPRNIFEFKEMEERISAGFDSLPIEIKEKFDFSFLQFAMHAGEPEWFEKLGYTEAQIKGSSDTVVKESESE